MSTYLVKSASSPVGSLADWDASVWRSAETACVDYFFQESSEFHPETRVRLLYEPLGIHGVFQVKDQFVRCLHSEYLDEVWKDACVEFFVKPKVDAGYFNFEMNCGGALLCFYIINPDRDAPDYVPIPLEDGKAVQITTTLPAIIDPEIVTPLTWVLKFFIPFRLLEKYVGSLGSLSGQVWSANFNKCAENNSHPHWATWNPLPYRNFHSPDHFGRLQFA